MKWIGLTGGIASGKSTVAKILRQKSVPVVDADEIVHRLMAKGERVNLAVAAHFGPAVVSVTGEIDRKILGEIVFKDPKKLEELEGIIHPVVRAETALKRDEWKRRGAKFAVYDVPLLFEKKMEKEFDGIACVVCSPAQQMQRLKDRNGFSDAEVNARMRAQIPLKEKAAKSTWLIYNDGSLRELDKQVEAFLLKLNGG